MKIALLLTGQLRTFEMVKYLHMNSLILKYDTDTFLGIDLNNKYQCEFKNSTESTPLEKVERAKDFFKPIDTFVLNEFDFFKDKYEHLLFRQYYVVKNTYKMLKTHIDNNNIKYDLIIRLRFDQLIYSNEVPISPNLIKDNFEKILYNEENTDIIKNYTLDKKFIFEEVKNNTIYVFGYGDFEHYKYCNDQFFYHDQSLLEKMFEFYDNIFNIMSYCNKKNIGNKGALI
jgi:hypothetical protein